MNISYSIVVCTIGREDRLRDLLASLVDQLGDMDELIVVSQGRHSEIASVVAEFNFKARTVLLRSKRGLSYGRNLGVRHATARPSAYLLFPNDNCSFQKGSLARLRTTLDGERLAFLPIAQGGEILKVFPANGERLNTRNVWSVLEAGLCIERSVFDFVGGFDEVLGVGAESPWQSGEGTDWLLRYLQSYPDAGCMWITDRSLALDYRPEQLSRRENRKKLRRYGRGLGYVVQRWGYPPAWKLRVLIRGLAFGFNKQDYGPLDGIQVFLGRLEGLIGARRDIGAQAKLEVLPR